MNVRTAILALASTVFFCAPILQAQQNEQLYASVIPGAEVAYVNSTDPSTPVISGEPLATDPAGAPGPQGGTAQGGTAPVAPVSDDQWHISVSPYLWFPGVHGTVGALGRDAGFKASPSDLLSHFRFGVMGAVEARRNRLLVPIDLMWIRLQDDKAIPFPPGLKATSATIKATEFILTPKIGVRLIDEEKIKVDALAGIRYWHFGENLQFSPSILGLNFSKSQNWVDPVVGGRITTALAPKVVFTMAGDVGGWGTGSQLEYQVVGLLGYKVKPNMTLQGGYRYLYVDYAKGGQAGAFVTVATSGVVFGVTVNLK
jgi:hypothetical protein